MDDDEDDDYDDGRFFCDECEESEDYDDGLMMCKECSRILCMDCGSGKILSCTSCWDGYCMDGDACFEGELTFCSKGCYSCFCHKCLPSAICPEHFNVMCSRCSAVIASHFSDTDCDIEIGCMDCVQGVEREAAMTFLLIARFRALGGIFMSKDVAKLIAELVLIPKICFY